MKKLTSLLLAAALVLSLAAVPGFAVSSAPASTDSSTWYSSQLSPQGKLIYQALCARFADGTLKDGAASVNLAAGGSSAAVSQTAIQQYLSGNQALLNDFDAAKTAFALEHPEAWYVDATRLTLRILQEAGGGTYHAMAGAGVYGSFHCGGLSLSSAEITSRSNALNAAVDRIVSGAKALSGAGLSSEELAARKVQYVQDQVIRSVSPRDEETCSDAGAPWLRTAYVLVSHEALPEGYARAIQLILQKLDIPCLCVWGVQTAGNVPETRMWNVVQVGDSWYLLDAAWDDPIYGAASALGADGGENDVCLLKGLAETGLLWQPADLLAGPKSFSVPELSPASFGSSGFVLSTNTLTAVHQASKASAGDAAEGGSEEGDSWNISFRGKGLQGCADSGFYLLMQSLDDTGSSNRGSSTGDWFYAEGLMILAKNGVENRYRFQDSAGALNWSAAGSGECVRFAVTTRAPERYDGWPAGVTSAATARYSGDGSDILARTDPLRCTSVAAAEDRVPQVSQQFPSSGEAVYAGAVYPLTVSFDNPLTRTVNTDWTAPDHSVWTQPIRVHYETFRTEISGKETAVELSGSMRMDKDRDGYVDPELLQWTWACTQSHSHDPAVCLVAGVSFPMDPSTAPEDNGVRYVFTLEGLAGSTSGKAPASWSISTSAGGSWYAPWNQGLHWNLWSSPVLMDSPASLEAPGLLVSEELSQGVGSQTAYEEYASASATLLPYLGLNAEDVAAQSFYDFHVDSFSSSSGGEGASGGNTYRILAGFPEGTNNSGAYAFRAYQLLRGTDGLIHSASEIPLAATPFGLVLTCGAQASVIVAAVKAGSGSAPAESRARTLLLTTEGNGQLSYQKNSVWYTAEAKTGSVVVDRTVTFSARPSAWYVLDGISSSSSIFGVLSQQTDFILSEIDVPAGNTLLRASFVPESLKTVESAAKLSLCLPQVCSHQHTILSGQTEPTCTEPGSTPTVSCRDCCQVLSESQPIPATGHSFGAAAVQGDSCIVARTIRYTCTTCGVQESFNLPAAAHMYGEPDIIEAPTCTQPGSQTLTCLLCAHTEEVPMPATGKHRTSGVVRSVLPTCTEPGQNIAVCLDCGQEITTEIPAAGHQFTKTEVTVPATCTESGKGVDVCAVCGAKSQEHTIEPLGHSYENRICTRCQQPEPFPFTDVPEDALYRTAVEYLYQHNLLGGTTPTTFSPDGTCTRSMLAVILYQISGSPEPEDGVKPIEFTDLTADWYRKAVDWASSTKVAAGDGKGHFSPDLEVSREQLVTFLMNYARSRGLDVSSRVDLSAFADADQVESWYLEPMEWAMSCGFLQASGTSLKPNAITLRQEMAWVLYQFCQYYKLY